MSFALLATTLGVLTAHHLYATGTTGAMLEYELGLTVTSYLSGPVGGDQQMGAKIAEGAIDTLIFFWDPLEPQPHDPGRQGPAAPGHLWNLPVATNVATADLIISSPLFHSDYRGQRLEIATRDRTDLVQTR